MLNLERSLVEVESTISWPTLMLARLAFFSVRGPLALRFCVFASCEMEARLFDMSEFLARVFLAFNTTYFR